MVDFPPLPKKKPTPSPEAEVPAPQWRIDTWFPDLDAETRSKFKLMHAELLKFNKTINLIGVKTIAVADAIHFADSILASRVIAKAGIGNEIYDFGSGNGFPGLIFATLYKSIKVYLVEVDQRKCEYMKFVISSLGLKNVEIKNQTVESLPERSVVHAMSRGFAPVSKSLLLARKVFKKDGIYFHLKSEEWVTEVSQIPIQLCSFWTPSLVGEYKLPIGEVQFAVIKTEKIAD